MEKVNIEVERIETLSLNARINYSPFQKHTSCNTCEPKPFCVNIISLFKIYIFISLFILILNKIVN